MSEANCDFPRVMTAFGENVRAVIFLLQSATLTSEMPLSSIERADTVSTELRESDLCVILA
jgi:hypothetical protein